MQTCQSKIECHISFTIRADIKYTNLYRHPGKELTCSEQFFSLCEKIGHYIIKVKSRNWKQQVRWWFTMPRWCRNATPNQEWRESSYKFRWMSLKPHSHVDYRFQSRQAQHQTWHYNLPLWRNSVTQKSIFDKYTVSSAKKCVALCVCVCVVSGFISFLRGMLFSLYFQKDK